MRVRCLLLLLAVASAQAVRTAGQAPAAGQFAPYKAPSLVGSTNPDLNGIWQAITTANWDIQDHESRAGLHPELEGAYDAQPGGQGIVEGGEIPYQPWALAKKQQNFENRMKVDTTEDGKRHDLGDPDLRGIYNNATSTPLQRPSKFGEKDVLTDVEAEGIEEEARANIDAAPRPDYATGNYNDFWFDPRRRELTADRRTSLIVDPPDGRIPALLPLSPEREKARTAAFEANRRFLDGKPSVWTEADTALRCLTRTDRPPYMPFAYNSNFQIFQGPGYVAISTEMVHSTRIIPVDGRPHLGQTIKNWLGDARGHWEGNTLVVETTNFRQEAVYGYAAAGYSTNASATVAATPVAANPATYHLTERFTSVAPNTVQYEFTISDPQTWVRPWTAMIPWTRMEDRGPEYQVYEYACHEDNYDAVHLLAGGRAREKADAAK